MTFFNSAHLFFYCVTVTVIVDVYHSHLLKWSVQIKYFFIRNRNSKLNVQHNLSAELWFITEPHFHPATPTVHDCVSAVQQTCFPNGVWNEAFLLVTLFPSEWFDLIINCNFCLSTFVLNVSGKIFLIVNVCNFNIFVLMLLSLLVSAKFLTEKKLNVFFLNILHFKKSL